MTTTPTYQVLVDDIKAMGVEEVFGLMSDDTAVFATALDSAGVRFYGARHENNAIAMADADPAPAASRPVEWFFCGPSVLAGRTTGVRRR